MRVALAEVPLGAARGGSGATLLQLVRVTLTADDGAEGTGFTYGLGAGAEAVMAVLEAVHLPAVRGLPLHRWDRTRYALRERTHRLGRDVSQLATSALDIAVWDLRAHRAGVLTPREGCVAVPDRPGHGIVWDYSALQRHARHRLDTAGGS